jgi:hypothetical protein
VVVCVATCPILSTSVLDDLDGRGGGCGGGDVDFVVDIVWTLVLLEVIFMVVFVWTGILLEETAPVGNNSSCGVSWTDVVFFKHPLGYTRRLSTVGITFGCVHEDGGCSGDGDESVDWTSFTIIASAGCTLGRTAVIVYVLPRHALSLLL